MRILLLTLCLALPATAEEWQALDAAGISAALSARVLRYDDGSTQNFFRDGRSLREAADGTRWGSWWVDGNQVCLLWPPSVTPDCMTVAARRIDLRFTAPDGEVRIARYVDL
ncbi:hypothetical protein [Tabrizicola flagellatus]|uniref:hypothetical protein n=1 Tax=Tabrizicola flagellatus TaxID=2593021 RepID=UPI0011F23F81|nr:hypothetical protein [Tabrizicola flagellatus]